MTKTKLWTDQSKLNKSIETHAAAAGSLQRFISEMKNVHVEVNQSNLNEALRSPETFCRAQWRAAMQGTVKPKTNTSPLPFPVKEVDILQDLQLPSTAHLKAMANEFIRYSSESLSYLKIVDGRAVLPEESVKILEETASIFAETEDQLQDWKLCTKVASSLTELSAFVQEKYGRQPLRADHLVLYIQSVKDIKGDTIAMPYVYEFLSRCKKINQSTPDDDSRSIENVRFVSRTVER